MDQGDQGGGERDPHWVHAFLAFLSFSEQYDSAWETIGGSDPLRSFQGVGRGGRSARPGGPGSRFRGRGGWAQSQGRQVSSQQGTPQDWHHAYPDGPSSGSYGNRQIGLQQGAPQDWHHAYPGGTSSGFTGMEGWQRWRWTHQPRRFRSRLGRRPRPRLQFRRRILPRWRPLSRPELGHPVRALV